MKASLPNALIMWQFPDALQTQCRGVHPSSSRASTLAFLERRYLTTSMSGSSWEQAMCIMVCPWSLRAVISFLESFFFNTVKEAPSKINCAITGNGYFIAFPAFFFLKNKKGGPLDELLLFTHTPPERAPCGSWPCGDG